MNFFYDLDFTERLKCIVRVNRCVLLSRVLGEFVGLFAACAPVHKKLRDKRDEDCRFGF